LTTQTLIDGKNGANFFKLFVTEFYIWNAEALEN